MISHRGTKDTEMKFKNNYYIIKKENFKERDRGENLNIIKKVLCESYSESSVSLWQNKGDVR